MKNYLFLIASLVASVAGATDISQTPLNTAMKVKPNVILGYDDSGSMARTYIPDSPTGKSTAPFDYTKDYGIPSFYYNPVFYNPNGRPYTPWVKKTHGLAPLGINETLTAGTQYRVNYACNPEGTSAAPTTTYNYLTGSVFINNTECLLNSNVFFTPSSNYTVLGGQTWTRVDIYPDAPAYVNATSTTTKNKVNLIPDGNTINSGSLTAGSVWQVTYSSTDCSSSTRPYDYDTGSRFANTTTGKNLCNAKSGNAYTIPSAYTIKDKQTWQKMGAYYYTVEAASYCTVNGTTCFTAPVCGSADSCAPTASNAKLYKRYVATDKLQSFYNWKQYASNRQLLVAYSMSKVLPDLKGINIGIQAFSPFDGSPGTITPTIPSMANTLTKDLGATAATYTSANYSSSGRMYSMDVPADVDMLLDIIYNTDGGSATPTHTVLKAIGNYYMNNTLPLTLRELDTSGAVTSPTYTKKGIIQQSCQKNYSFLLTDGYANLSSLPSAITYTKNASDLLAPYATTYSKSLADIALAYYNLNLRTDMAAGQVSVSRSTKAGDPSDLNTNLHMNTFAITLGADGDKFEKPAYANENADPYNNITNTGFWVNSTTSTNNTKQIDDLWHATINGRGKMLSATNVDTLTTNVKGIFEEITVRAGAQSAVAVANVNMTRSNNYAYVATYDAGGWSGDVQKYVVDASTGAVNTATSTWSASNKWTATTSANRKMVTWNGVTGILYTPSAAYGLGSFGANVNAEPVVIETGGVTTVYQASNDGMLHVIDGANGNPLWSYLPKFVVDRTVTTAKSFLLDGTPVVSNVNGTILLVGGAGVAGTGYYALDITDPTDTTLLINKVKWEFPKTVTDKANMGTSSSKPLVISLDDDPAGTKAVVVSSGYNNGTGTGQSGGDGKGHVWLLNPLTGAVLKEYVTSTASDAASTKYPLVYPLGMASLSAYAVNQKVSQKAVALYGGDERGNVWRVNLAKATTDTTAFTRVAVLSDADDITQPITTAPELMSHAKDAVTTYPIIYIGTGRMLGTSDLTTATVQGFYAIKDSGSATMTRESTITKPDGVEYSWLKKDVSTTGSAMTNDSHVKDPVYTSAQLEATPKPARVPFSFDESSAWFIDFPVAGERSVGDSAFALGQITFTTNAISADACASASFIYVLDKTGNEVKVGSIAGVENTGRKLIGAFTVSRPVIVKLPSGKVVALFNHGGSIETKAFSSSNRPARTVSWKEIVR